MKELLSLLSPFGAVKINPLKGLEVAVEDTTSSQAPIIERSEINGNGKVIVPTGAGAIITINSGEERKTYTVEDYRPRYGKTLGAKIAGKNLIIRLDRKNRNVFIPGVGYVSYKKDITKTKK